MIDIDTHVERKKDWYVLYMYSLSFELLKIKNTKYGNGIILGMKIKWNKTFILFRICLFLHIPSIQTDILTLFNK